MTTTSSQAFPKCPFCGCLECRTEQHKTSGFGRNAYWWETGCTKCSARVSGNTADEAEANWRRRPT